MTKTFILIAFICSSLCFSQKESTHKFDSKAETLSYREIDYSKHGVSQIFVSCYESSDQNAKTYDKAVSCLKKKYNLYHTFYYFVEVPKGKTQEEKEIVFADFMNFLVTKNNFKSIDIYLSFDKDYAKKFAEDTQDDGRSNVIKRVADNLTSKNVCQSL